MFRFVNAHVNFNTVQTRVGKKIKFLRIYKLYIIYKGNLPLNFCP